MLGKRASGSSQRRSHRPGNGTGSIRAALAMLHAEEHRIARRSAAIAQKKAELEKELRRRCGHTKIVHVAGGVIDHRCEPGCLDVRPPFRRCVNCGAFEDGVLTDEDIRRITQADVLSRGAGMVELIDELAKFSLLSGHQAFWVRRDIDGYVRSASREEIRRLYCRTDRRSVRRDRNGGL